MKTEPKLRTVAILIFEGVELLDFAGPADVFIVAGEGKAFRVVTVAASAEPLKTMGGITLKPDFAYKDAPKADIVVIPGGDMRNVTAAGVDWIRQASKDSEITLSVCMGAFLLARAQLLDGVSATTHHWGLAGLQKAAPKCKVVTGQRYVDNGRIVTAAGVTAGIDGALHIVERLLGPQAARWTADEWLEHRRPTPTTAPAN
ncbi:MAG: DJ-1/PfpI family protein [Phycisphaerae bacterium]|nr:DJ-1/PfpI family protein [Phycisphaerae bacterium]